MTFHSTILIDLDGTLVDSVAGIHVAAVAAAEATGSSAPTIEFVRDAIGRGADRLVHRVCSERHDGMIDQELHARARRRFDEVYVDACLAGTFLRSGAVTALETLRREGRRLVVATNKPRRPAAVVLRHLEIEDLVDRLVCPDDAGVAKPDPRFVETAVGEGPIGAALFVGDSSIDSATARAAGIPFIAIRGGYDEGRRIEEVAPPPDRIIDEPGELSDAVHSIDADRRG